MVEKRRVPKGGYIGFIQASSAAEARKKVMAKYRLPKPIRPWGATSIILRKVETINLKTGKREYLYECEISIRHDLKKEYGG